MKLAATQIRQVLSALDGIGASTSPANSAAGTNRERRRSPRMPFVGEVEISVANGKSPFNWTLALTHDISEQSMGLLCATPFQRGGHLAVKLPTSMRGHITMLCQIIACRMAADGIYKIGLQFVRQLDGSGDEPVACVADEQIDQRTEPKRQRNETASTSIR